MSSRKRTIFHLLHRRRTTILCIIMFSSTISIVTAYISSCPLRYSRERITYQCSKASSSCTNRNNIIRHHSSLFSTKTSSSSSSSSDSKNLLLQQRTDILRTNSKLSLAPMMEYTGKLIRVDICTILGATHHTHATHNFANTNALMLQIDIFVIWYDCYLTRHCYIRKWLRQMQFHTRGVMHCHLHH